MTKLNTPISTSGTSTSPSFHFVMPLQMTWKPKEDITTYELAMCLPFLFSGHIMPNDIDRSLPHFRHFIIIDPNIK